ncbi:hypothetical protein V7S43_018459 [Phytophthora oleae]|uniref:Phosphatidylinositol N-acetylglucosaminyltransferase subunit Y n=1 Tax=Phytophthora oleae TaxID=2107226 RepID=A0ABD3EQH4_9STRA
MAKVVARRVDSTSHVWGYVIVLMAALVFIASMYAMIFSKLLPEDSVDTPSPNLLVALERDVYYCYLIPLTIPVTILTFYANWVSLKFFRHN